MSKNNNILSRDVLYANIKKTYDNIEKDMQLIKNSLKSHRKEICNIKKRVLYANIKKT